MGIRPIWGLPLLPSSSLAKPCFIFYTCFYSTKPLCLTIYIQDDLPIRELLISPSDVNKRGTE